MILTARLVLRRWRPDDRAPFATLNSDPEVMRFMPRPLSPAESDRWVDRIDNEFDRDGFGLWALEASGEASAAPGRAGWQGGRNDAGSSEC